LGSLGTNFGCNDFWDCLVGKKKCQIGIGVNQINAQKIAFALLVFALS